MTAQQEYNRIVGPETPSIYRGEALKFGRNEADNGFDEVSNASRAFSRRYPKFVPGGRDEIPPKFEII